jgi:hypothetical protein
MYERKSIRLEMLQLLLDRGALANESYKSFTARGRFILSLHNGQVPSRGKTLLQTIKMLPLYGANLEKRVIIGHTQPIRGFYRSRTSIFVALSFLLLPFINRLKKLS